MEMSKKNICPECKKYHKKLPEQCMCGCYLVQEDKGSNQKCPFIESDGHKCGKPATKSYSTKHGSWYCSKHADELLQRSYVH